MNTVIKMKFGSHLYGTNTESSDLDYKSVHIPCGRDILLQRVQGSVTNTRSKKDGEKNTVKDIDTESYSLQKYLQLLSEGQTSALDMLFAPQSVLIESSWVWDIIQKNRHKLLTKKSASFVGYCRTQANKYGIKGSRVAAAKAASEYFYTYYHLLHNHTVGGLSNSLRKLVAENSDHMAIIQQKQGSNGELGWYFECCNRKVPFTSSVKVAYDTYSKVHKSYGDRAQLASSNEGVDWKALSHAVRVGQQALELLLHHKIEFPLADREHILAIKKGELPYKEVAKEIEDLLVEVEEAAVVSTLPDSVDQEWIDEFVYDVYRKEVVENYRR